MCKAGEGEAIQAISSLECSRRLLSGKTSCDKNGAAERKVWVETQGRALPGFGAGGRQDGDKRWQNGNECQGITKSSFSVVKTWAECPWRMQNEGEDRETVRAAVPR